MFLWLEYVFYDCHKCVYELRMLLCVSNVFLWCSYVVFWTCICFYDCLKLSMIFVWCYALQNHINLCMMCVGCVCFYDFCSFLYLPMCLRFQCVFCRKLLWFAYVASVYVFFWCCYDCMCVFWLALLMLCVAMISYFVYMTCVSVYKFPKCFNYLCTLLWLSNVVYDCVCLYNLHMCLQLACDVYGVIWFYAV